MLGMKRVSVFLSDQQIDALDALSEDSGLPKSELLRRAIDDFVRRELERTGRRDVPVKKSRSKK